MNRLCIVCAEEAVENETYCKKHLQRAQLDYSALYTIIVFLLLTMIILWPVSKKVTSMSLALPTEQPTRTLYPTPTATCIPTSTSTPTPSPTTLPTPTPTIIINRAVLVNLDANGIYVLAAIISSEASGMGADGKALVACNVLKDLYNVGGSWDSITFRWAQLENILAGNAPREPVSEDYSIANAATDGRLCEDYPTCEFLGNIQDVYTWLSHNYISAGRYDLWVADSGQMLVCIEGSPTLPAPPEK